MLTKMNPVDCQTMAMKYKYIFLKRIAKSITSFSEVEQVFYGFWVKLILLSFKIEHLLKTDTFGTIIRKTNGKSPFSPFISKFLILKTQLLIKFVYFSGIFYIL